MADIVYKIKDGTEIGDFLTLGYDLVENNMLIKVIEVDDKNELSLYLFKKYYNNPNWRTKIYEPNKKAIVDAIDLKYNKYGDVRPSRKLDKMMHNWNIIIDLQDDIWLGFSSSDPFDQEVFYNKKLFDKHFASEIELLKKHDLIDEFEARP